MNDNKALCIFLCVLALCMTTCSVSSDWAAIAAKKCEAPSAPGKTTNEGKP